MISVSEAKKIIRDNVVSLQPQQVPLVNAVGKVLAEDIFSPISLPPFPQSSMDGYAFGYEDWKKNKQLIIEGVIEAGNTKELKLATGKAVRIFTGAPVPSGADTVVMQEKVSVKDNELIIEDAVIEKGNNVRQQGAEIKQGDLALCKGSLITPAVLAFIAGLGIPEVNIIPDPRFSLVVTGNELQRPGSVLTPGKVYESNSFSLTAAIKQAHTGDTRIFYCEDELGKLTETLQIALKESDVVLLTGGISVGDYDFVLKASENCGVKKLFHKIKQRPGKPLFFGKKEDKLVFGLPGNPSSVLTCFYEYVLLASALLTQRDLGLREINAPLSASFTRKAMLTHFLKGYYDGKEVSILNAQESYRMSSFARANCFVVIEEEVSEYEQGTAVNIHLLPS